MVGRICGAVFVDALRISVSKGPVDLKTIVHLLPQSKTRLNKLSPNRLTGQLGFSFIAFTVGHILCQSETQQSVN